MEKLSKLSLDDEIDDELSDYDESDMIRADEKEYWLSDVEEKNLEYAQEDEVEEEEEEVGDENRPLFNPASLVKKSFAYQSLSHVPYPKEDSVDTDMIFWTLQVKPKTMNADIVQMFYCLSSIVQTQIKEDEDSDSAFSVYPVFDIPFPSLGTSMGGDFPSISEIPDSLMEREDEATKPYIMEGRVPMFFTVFRFMIHLNEQVRYDRECNVMALVYLNRITVANNMALTNRNWRMLWLVAVMVAQKVWSHKPERSFGICSLYEDLRHSVFKRAERAMATMLDYNTGVRPSLYAKYYLELNELFNGLMKTLHIGNGREVWDWEPVSDFTKAILKRKCIRAAADREAKSSKRAKK